MIRVEIIGNLGADAKIVRTQHGDFASLSVACTRKYKGQDGVLHEEKHWVGVSINWNCSNLLPYLVKGAKVFAAGRCHLRAYPSKVVEGQWEAGLDIVADTLELCGGKQEDPKPF